MAKNKGLFGTLTFLIGLIFGGLITLIFSTDEKGEMRESLKDRVGDLKAKLKEVSETERIKTIYGNVSKEATARYRQAKNLLIDKLALLKTSLKDVDQDKYKKVVNEVIAQLKEDGSMTATELKKLGSYLAQDYHKLVSKSVKKSKTV